jgi:hypothetical protein
MYLYYRLGFSVMNAKSFPPMVAWPSSHQTPPLKGLPNQIVNVIELGIWNFRWIPVYWFIAAFINGFRGYSGSNSMVSTRHPAVWTHNATVTATVAICHFVFIYEREKVDTKEWQVPGKYRQNDETAANFLIVKKEWIHIMGTLEKAEVQTFAGTTESLDPTPTRTPRNIFTPTSPWDSPREPLLF